MTDVVRRPPSAAHPLLGPVLFGSDDTTGIVSVVADGDGRARVWRRTARGGVELAEHDAPGWFLLTTLELVGHLPFRHLSPEGLRATRGNLDGLDGLHVVTLAGGDAGAYRYLVLTDSPADVEAEIVETYNKRVGGSAGSLHDLRGLVLALPPTEQFLLLRGCSYFRGLDYAEVVRFQFDLETTGLDEQRDRIFMISMRDSTGWRECLDTRSLTEAALIQRFVDLVQQRDPDVLENHNIFAFDLPFLVRRAANLGVRLRIGRDGSAPTADTDVFHTGDHGEPFGRWRVIGREVVDTQQAVRRYGSGAPDMRRVGLKDAARYFGFARADREYVPGAEIWPTFRQDPERVRRYASDDVDEADGLSRRLLPPVFALATMVPRPLERLAADMSAPSLVEPLLLRAYLRSARAIPAPLARGHAPAGDRQRRPDLLVRGVVPNPVIASAAGLYAALLVAGGERPGNDDLGAFPAAMAEAVALADEQRAASGRPEGTDDDRARHAAWATAAETLAGCGLPYLERGGLLFADAALAARVLCRGRQVVDRLLVELRQRGATVVEVDGPRVIFAAPDGWGDAEAAAMSAAAGALLPPPPGVELRYDVRYRAMYARSPGSHIWSGRDGSIVLVGQAFRPGKRERFGEQFVRQAATPALLGDVVAVRQLFLDTVARLRNREIPVEHLCVQEILHKAPEDYRRAGYREEPYEVLLASGARTWRPGQRVRYFHDASGGVRLLQEGDSSIAQPDTGYYLERLRTVYCQQFAAAFAPDDFARIFRLPKGPPGDGEDDDLAGIKPIAEPVLTTLQM